jgi:hypothetical protein
MKNFDSRTYSINDFLQWKNQDEIILNPRFQRRDVWSEKARSYFIDSVIRGKPTHKIFIRQVIDPRDRKTTREVVDGQQRLRTIFTFINDEFSISKSHNEKFSKLLFSELPVEIQKDILQYELTVDLLLDASDEEVLDIFARLNSYARTLNSQEKLHAKWFGEFKQTVYSLGLEYLKFWTMNKILTDSRILRMAEAELTSDLLIAMSDGIHSKKTIPNYYEKYDEIFPHKKRMVNEFRETMDTIGNIMESTLPESNYRRIHMFYTLFCTIYHHLFGLPNFPIGGIKFSKRDYYKIKIALNKVDNIFEKNEIERTLQEREFLDAARRATTDAPVRIFRNKFLTKLINQQLQG